jgi:hypothetical protein
MVANQIGLGYDWIRSHGAFYGRLVMGIFGWLWKSGLRRSDQGNGEDCEFPDDEKYESSFEGGAPIGLNFDYDPPPDTFF